MVFLQSPEALFPGPGLNTPSCAWWRRSNSAVPFPSRDSDCLFSPISTDEGKSTGDLFFALSRDDPGAVTFTTVAGRLQVGGDFAFEAGTKNPLPGDRGEGRCSRDAL